MSVTVNVKPSPSDLNTFVHVVGRALVRAEAHGRTPPRFTDTGSQLWAAFRNELTDTDLLDLAVQDLAATMPQFFALDHLWPEACGEELRTVPPSEVSQCIAQALAKADEPTEAYLQGQAEVLGIKLAATESLEDLPHTEAHHRVLELTGSGGWLAYRMASRPDAAVYYWENFTIACATWRELLLAGLIAFELGAPARRELPIMKDPTLVNTLKEDVAFDLIVGVREENWRRADALQSFLRPGGLVVLL